MVELWTIFQELQGSKTRAVNDLITFVDVSKPP